MNRNTKLSDRQVMQYQEQGYLVPDYQLPGELLEKMRAAYDRLLENNVELGSDFLLGPHLQKSGSQGVKGAKEWFELATHPDLMDMAAQLIGEDIILWGTTIFGKPAKGGKGTPWHQDGDYYPIRPLETMTIWIALDDVTPENGPMSFIPGSHKGKKQYSHHREERDNYTIFDVCDSVQFDESAAVDLVIKAGQVSYHDVYMIHGSKPNLTEHRRAAFVVRLMPASSFYDHELGRVAGEKNSSHDYGSRSLFLVRGKDICAKNDFSIGH
jgi:hypothetical protein